MDRRGFLRASGAAVAALVVPVTQPKTVTAIFGAEGVRSITFDPPLRLGAREAVAIDCFGSVRELRIYGKAVSDYQLKVLSS